MLSAEAQKASYHITGADLALFRGDNTKGTILGPSPLAGGTSFCMFVTRNTEERSVKECDRVENACHYPRDAGQREE
jgi:hypothetical protein